MISFLTQRKKGKGGETTQATLARQGNKLFRTEDRELQLNFTLPDIRTAYISLILSFVSPGTPLAIKLAFLETKATFISVFTDIVNDPVDVIKRTLHIAWEGIWGDASLPLSLKVGLFMEKTLGQVR